MDDSTLQPDLGNDPARSGKDALVVDPPPVAAKPRLSPRVIAIARVVLLALVIAAASWTLFHNWAEVQRAISHMSWTTVVGATALVAVGIGCGTLSWQVFVDDLGTPIGIRRGGQIFLVGQLGKYLPGSVWAYVLQLELGRRAGLARTRVFTATVFSLMVAVVGALIVGALALPQLVSEDPSLAWVRWLYVLLPFGLVCLHPKVLTAVANFGFKLLRRPRPTHPVRRRTVLHSLAWALGSYCCYGVQLWLLVGSDADLGRRQLLLFIGSMGIAMVAGLFAILLPSGAGVRELVIVTVLTPLVGVGAAIAYAAVSRVLFTLADLLMAGGAAALAAVARRREGPYVGDPGIEV
ncbi:lysylphosphatidylglycerol synthase transmembrane domain-containing protein [Cellulomonas sp. URHE0023]|uniref:lysylphosphatidylglycerol synthase transmembrane domain-containing protein n=1 Tax=Cellulomonas sp. URHE0023 TaxID=1380354 RepID=UPI00068DE84A|nr:lysylphosphatidylglycerol synthase transmembrane domain-containing protein [Cellulomonas sp. URHE0023]